MTITTLQTLSSTVQSAANPILLQQAVAAFGTNTPDLNAFLKKGSEYCSAFKTKFPETVVVQKKQAGVVRAAWETASYLFHALTTPLDEFPEAPSDFIDLYSSILDQGRNDLSQIDANLIHLENLLNASPQEGTEKISQEIRALREQKIILEACPPQVVQGEKAMQAWKDDIARHLKASSQLVHTAQRAATAKLAQNSETREAKELRTMVETKFSSPMSEPVFASFVADEIGQNTHIEQSNLPQFVSFLKPLAIASKNAVLIQAADDVEKFESFLAPFRAQLLKYPFQRFMKDGVEYEEVVAPVVKKFKDELNSRLQALDGKTRSSVFIPITVARKKFGFDDVKNLGKSAVEYSLFRIEKSGRNYDIRMYESAPQGTAPFTPYRIFKGVSKKQLLDQAFIKELLQYSSSVSKANEMTDIGPLVSQKWRESRYSCGWYTNALDCMLRRISSTIGETVFERNQDFRRSLEALNFFQHDGKAQFADFLSRHLQSAETPSITTSFSGKTANNPWGIWEALILDENRPDLLFDFKLSGLVALSQTQKKTDEENEILLNLGKLGLVELNRQLSDSSSIPKEKFLYAHSVLEEVKERLAERQRELYRSMTSKIKPVETAPIFATPSKEVALPKVHPVAATSQSVISKMELLGDFRDWTPDVDNLEPLHTFAKALDASYKNDNFDGIIVSTKNFFQAFNMARLDESFWNNLSANDAADIFSSLDKISTFYFKSYFDANVPKLPDAESTLLMMESMVLADRLMAKLPSDHNMQHLNMPLSEIAPYLFNRGMFFHFGDPKLDERLLALQTYCQKALEKGINPLFSTNMSPIYQTHPTLGLVIGEFFSSPRIILEGVRAFTTPEGHYIPENWRIQDEDSLKNYLEHFIPEYDQKHLISSATGMLNIEKMKRMLTGEAPGVLPPTFDGARGLAYRTGYFLRGTFVKPSNFRKTDSSYNLSFHAKSLFNAIPGMSMMMSSMGLRVWSLTAQIEGIDKTVFDENTDLADGISSAHQFAHLQRPVVDPVVKGIQAPHFKQLGDPAGDAFHVEDRWGRSYRSFAPGITEAGRNLHDLNVVMVQPVQELKKYLTKQQYEQFASLRTEPSVQVANSLSFFRKNSNLLHIPDMQSEFIKLVFDPTLLIQELRQPNRGPALERQLAAFISGEYVLNSQTGNIESSDFYLALISRLRQYCLLVRKQNPDVYQQNPLPEIFVTFPNLLQKAIDLADDTSKGMLNGLAAQGWMSEDSLSQEDGETFLRHVILYNQFPESGKTVDPLLKANIKTLMARFAPDISKLSFTQDFFDGLVREAYPQLPQNAEFTPSSHNPLVFSVKDHPVTVDLSQGLVIAPGIEGIPLPADGLNSPVYTSLYGSREFRCKAISNSIFEFKDMHGQTNRLIRRPDGEFVIHRRFPSRSKGWYQYIPQELLLPENKKNAQEDNVPKEIHAFSQKMGALLDAGSDKPLPILPAMPLIEGHSHWHTETTPAEMLIVDKLGRIAYRAEIDSSQILKTESSPTSLTKIHRLSADGKDQLDLIDSTTESFSWIRQFENPEQILIWKNPRTQEPERIEFPRFGSEGLSFTREGNVFKSDQFSGYTLKRDQINPLGVNCPNFLLLQNKKGEEKLILARQEITPSQKSSLSSRLSFERYSQVPGSKVPFHVYDKTSSSKALTSQDIAANFYLATIYGAQGQYKEAITLLRQFGQGSNPFTGEEKGILSWIEKLDVTINNDSPQLTSLRALAQATKVRNLNAHNHEKQKNGKNEKSTEEQEELRKLKDVAIKYFAGAKKLGLFRLTPDEEIFLLQYGLRDGRETEDLVRINQMMTEDVEKAKVLLLFHGNLGDSTQLNSNGNKSRMTQEELLAALKKPTQAFSKSSPIRSIDLEPILEDPMAFVEKLETPTDTSIEDSLKQLFQVEGITESEQNGLEFYLQDSLAYLKKKDKTEYRLKDMRSFKAKRSELEQTYSYMQESLVQAEFAILRRVAKPSQDAVEQARTVSQAQGNAVAPMDMNDLILLYMKHDLPTLRSSNPELTEADIQEIDKLIDLYLDLSVQNSQRKRVIGKMLDIEQFGSLSENDATLKLALQAFVSEAETKRHFDPANNRFLKVFEYHNGFYYRKNQIEKLQHLGVQLSGSNNEANLMESLVLEMMVGAGKTTYLLPTKGFWSANGERLSMAIMPEALIGNMSKEVERILGKTFAQKVKRFVFNRNTDLSPEHLESVLKMLKDAIEKKDYLITTDKSLKAFINQYAKVFKAALDAKAKFLAENTGRSRNLSQELMNLPEVVTAKLMTEILSVFKEKADVLCDEADLILDPRRELNFPEGEATSIPENYLSLSLQVYKFLLSPEIQEITSFEFSPNDQDACTPKIYEERVKPALVQKIIASLSQKEGTQSFKDLRTFYSTCSKDQKEMLENYFSGHDAEHAAENWIRGLQDDNIRQELGLLRGQLNVLLPLTLQKNYGERYGFHTDESILADPFSGSNNPNFGSQFSDPFERIDYTIQAYLKEPGMRRAVLEKLVHDLKTSAWKEMQENLEAIRKLPAGTEYKTAAHKEFERFFGQRKNLSLFSTKEVLIERLMDLLKEDPTAKFDLIEKYVLPQVKIYTQNLKSTSQSIGFLFTNPRGFTGTLWNKGTYHDSFNALFDDGARGQVVTLAYTQAKDKVSTVKIKKAKNLHKELIIDNPKYRHVKALIDAGGALKELDLKEVAEDWLKALTKQGSPIQGVVYFDKVTDQAYILERGESAPIPLTKSSCPIDKRVTIYDQKHTTGTDIKQAIDAVALVTVSKGMIIRDFIQAVGRMRQLASGQRIEIAVLEQDAVAIRELLKLDPKAELKIDDVLRFLIINEVRRQGEDNQVATTHKLTGVLQQWFLEKVLKASDFSEILTNFTHPELIEGLFFQTSEITPFKSYGQGTDLIDAKTAYAGKQESLISRLGLESICGSDSFLGSCLATVQNLMKTVIDLAELPSLVSGSPYAGDMEEEQEIMQEQETQQEQQQQQEELQDKDAGHTPWRHSQWTFLNSASVEKATIYEPTTVSANEWRRPTYAHFLKANDVMGSKIFDDAFELSHNFQLNGRVFQGSAVRPFGEFQKTIQNIIIVQNKKTKQFKVIAVEPHDAASFKKALQEKQKLKPTAKDPDLQAKPGHWYNYAKDYFSANNHGWTCLTGLDSNGRQSYYYDSCNRDAPDGESSEEWYHDANQDRWVQPKRVSKEGYSQGDDVSVWIGDLELNSLYESQDPIARADLESDKVARLLVQAKYFNGDVHYTDSQKKLLKQWLKDTKISAEALEQEFTKTIIAFNEQSKRDYPKSALYQIFAELKGTS